MTQAQVHEACGASTTAFVCQKKNKKNFLNAVLEKCGIRHQMPECELVNRSCLGAECTFIFVYVVFFNTQAHRARPTCCDSTLQVCQKKGLDVKRTFLKDSMRVLQNLQRESSPHNKIK